MIPGMENFRIVDGRGITGQAQPPWGPVNGDVLHHRAGWYYIQARCGREIRLHIPQYRIIRLYLELAGPSKFGIDHGQTLEIVLPSMWEIRKDKKRYWRILCDQGKIFLVYVDLLRLLVKLVREGAIDIGSLKEDYAAALAIVPAINLLYNVITE